jgi:hypothetical protein
VFILLHSLIGNKLERFMLPILPVFFLLTLQGVQRYLANTVIRYAFIIFAVLNILVLGPIVLSRSQLNIIDAAEYLSTSQQPLVLYKIDLWKQGYMTFKKAFPADFSEIAKLREYLMQNKLPALQLLVLGPLGTADQHELEQAGYLCRYEKEFHPSWQEKLVIKMNPKFNARRDTSYLYGCRR